MEFHFSDYTFSAIISVFSAIIGLAFPFCLSMIHRFQDIYKTDNVVEWFVEEQAYKEFLWILKLSIPITISMPFILFLVDPNRWLTVSLLVLQSVLAATMICKLVLLYYLIIDYSSSRRLVERTKDSEIEKMAWLMLMSDNNSNQEAYDSAKSKVYDRIANYLKSAKENLRTKELSFHGEVENVVIQLLKASSCPDKYPSISKDLGLVYFIYDYVYFKLPLSDQIYKLMWRALNDMVKARNDIWLRGYWSAALQYVMYMRSEQSHEQYEDRFKLMHLFYGALLLGDGYDDMLRYILTFRNVTSEASLLLPSTENDLFNALLKVDQLKATPFTLSKDYPMFFLPFDVRCDERIYSTFMDYLALILLLLSLNRSCHENECFVIPSSLSEEDLLYIQEIIEAFQDRYVNKAKEYAKYMLGVKDFDQLYKDGKDRIETVLLKCAEQRKFIKDEIDPDKLGQLKQRLINTYRTANFPFAERTDKGIKGEAIRTKLCVQATLSPGQIMKGRNTVSVNFENVLISMMRRQVYEQLAQIFLFNKPRVSYLIQNKDILQALDKLNIDDTYVLLNNGVNLWSYGIGSGQEHIPQIRYTQEGMFYKGMEFLSVGGGNNEFFILKKSDLPYFTVEDSEPKDGLDLLDTNSKLYWAEPTLKNHLSVVLCQTILFHLPISMRYIKLRISYDTAKGDFNLGEIKDIRNYVV